MVNCDFDEFYIKVNMTGFFLVPPLPHAGALEYYTIILLSVDNWTAPTTTLSPSHSSRWSQSW